MWKSGLFGVMVATYVRALQIHCKNSTHFKMPKDVYRDSLANDVTTDHGVPRGQLDSPMYHWSHMSLVPSISIYM